MPKNPCVCVSVEINTKLFFLLDIFLFYLSSAFSRIFYFLVCCWCLAISIEIKWIHTKHSHVRFMLCFFFLSFSLCSLRILRGIHILFLFYFIFIYFVVHSIFFFLSFTFLSFTFILIRNHSSFVLSSQNCVCVCVCMVLMVPTKYSVIAFYTCRSFNSIYRDLVG